MEGSSKRLVPLPAVHRDTHSSSSAHSPNSLTWAVCRDGAPPPLWATCASASPPSVPNLLPHLHSQSPLLSSEAISPSPIADPTMESVPSLLTAPLDADRPLSALLLLPSLLHAAQPQLSACPRREGFHPCHHFCVPPLDTALQQLHVSPALRTPPVDAVLQVRCHSAQLWLQPRVRLAFCAARCGAGLFHGIPALRSEQRALCEHGGVGKGGQQRVRCGQELLTSPAAAVPVPPRAVGRGAVKATRATCHRSSVPQSEVSPHRAPRGGVGSGVVPSRAAERRAGVGPIPSLGTERAATRRTAFFPPSSATARHRPPPSASLPRPGPMNACLRPDVTAGPVFTAVRGTGRSEVPPAAPHRAMGLRAPPRPS